MNILTKGYGLYIKTIDCLAPFFLLVVRGYIGYRFFRTGMGKLENLPAITEYFTSLGIPFPALNACMAGATEMFGGALLLVGLGSRIIALPLLVTMVVAYMTAHKESVLGFFDEPSTFFSQEPFPFLATALLVLFTGAGRWSFDEALRRRFSAKEPRKDASM
jgi:putative oxidoreductase